jgi:hypothetical protein
MSATSYVREDMVRTKSRKFAGRSRKYTVAAAKDDEFGTMAT